MSAAQVNSEHHGGSRNLTSDAAQFISDEALVAGAKMGHGRFFDELHKRHRERMFWVAHRITRHREDAQDAVQESFLSAYVHLKKFDERARFSTWLTRIAVNAALTKIRKTCFPIFYARLASARLWGFLRAERLGSRSAF